MATFSSFYSVLRAEITASLHQMKPASPTELSKLATLMIAAASLATFGANAQIGAGSAEPTMPMGNAIHGQLVYRAQNCDKCHGAAGEGMSAPGRSGLPAPISSTPLA